MLLWVSDMHTVLDLTLIYFVQITLDTIMQSTGLSAARASRLLFLCLHLPSEVQHATAFKGRDRLVSGCQLCQSLTWLCSPELSPPLSLSRSPTSTTLTSILCQSQGLECSLLLGRNVSCSRIPHCLLGSSWQSNYPTRYQIVKMKKCLIALGQSLWAVRR